MSGSSKNTAKTYLIAYSKPAIWAMFIFFLSAQQSLPGFSTSIFDFIFKKSAHAFVYAVLYFLLFRAQREAGHQSISYKSYLIPALIALIYTLTDELHQSTVPTRHPALRDVGFDMLGVTTVLLYQLKFR